MLQSKILQQIMSSVRLEVKSTQDGMSIFVTTGDSTTTFGWCPHRVHGEKQIAIGRNHRRQIAVHMLVGSMLYNGGGLENVGILGQLVVRLRTKSKQYAYFTHHKIHLFHSLKDTYSSIACYKG
jgi:hypothetical protein